MYYTQLSLDICVDFLYGNEPRGLCTSIIITRILNNIDNYLTAFTESQVRIMKYRSSRYLYTDPRHCHLQRLQQHRITSQHRTQFSDNGFIHRTWATRNMKSAVLLLLLLLKIVLQAQKQCTITTNANVQNNKNYMNLVHKRHLQNMPVT